MRIPISPSAAVAGVAAAFAAALALVFQRTGRAYMLDDAYITSVYAENLARGEGLVFNAGERVWGYTSPAHTLLLGALSVVGRADTLGLLLCLALAVPCAVLAYRLAERAVSSAGYALFVALFLVTAPSFFYHYLGLESNLLLLLQLSFLSLAVRGSAGAAGLVGALSCLCRPDSVLLVLPILIMHRPLRTPRAFLGFALPGLAWLGFAYAYYGEILPNSFYGKVMLTPFFDYLRSTAYKVLVSGVPAQRIPSPQHLTPMWLVGAAKVGTSLAALRLIPAGSGRPLRYALLVYPYALITSYALIGSHIEHLWEVHSAYFFFTLGYLCGAFAIARAAWERLSERAAVRRGALVALGAGGLLLLALNAQRTFAFFADQRTDPKRGARHRTYVELARVLDERLPEGARVAFGEPGTVRYFMKRSDIRLVDWYRIISRGPRSPLPPPRNPCRGFPRDAWALWEWVYENYQPGFVVADRRLAGWLRGAEGESAAPSAVCGGFRFSFKDLIPGVDGFSNMHLVEVIPEDPGAARAADRSD